MFCSTTLYRLCTLWLSLLTSFSSTNLHTLEPLYIDYVLCGCHTRMCSLTRTCSVQPLYIDYVLCGCHTFIAILPRPTPPGAEECTKRLPGAATCVARMCSLTRMCSLARMHQETTRVSAMRWGCLLSGQGAFQMHALS